MFCIGLYKTCLFVCWSFLEWLRVVGVVGREEEFELPFLDLEEETGIDKVEIETIREIEQGKIRKSSRGEGVLLSMEVRGG